MAEVETKSEIIESKEKMEVSEPEIEDGEESKENNENGDGDESSENISKSTRTPLKTITPLFDSPLTQSGKRVRAKSEQWVTEIKEEYKYEFNGSGVALGEIPFIEFMMNKETTDGLKKLHSICFGRTGDKSNVRKNLRQFNGYSFGTTDQKFEAKKANMDTSRFTMVDLKTIFKMLGLETSGTKIETIGKILEFLQKPKDAKKNLPGSKKKKKSGNKKKRSDKGKKRSPKSKEGVTENDSTANDENDSTANDENDSTANDSTADSSSDSGSDSETEEKPKKTPAKKPAKTPAKKVTTKTPAKKTPAKKTPAKKTPAKKAPAKRSKDVVDSDSDSSDDEPLIKKTKTAPSNDEIKQKVEKILEGADLEEVTMKSVCKKIYEMYPGFDLTDRKTFIKDTVRAVLG